MKWLHYVKLKHLFTREEDYTSVSESMAAIAKEIKKHDCFNNFDTKLFCKIPKGDEFFRPVEYANKLIDSLYNYADDRAIWIE
jgi:hypothetical protein